MIQENFNIIFTSFILSLFCLIICLLRNKFADYLKLSDPAPNPLNIRKIHKVSTPLIGGVACYVSLVSSVGYSFFFLENINLKFYLLLTFLMTIFLILGVLDDKKDLTPLVKSTILVFSLFILIPLDQDLIIKNLEFKYFIDRPIILNQAGLVFTIFCLYLFYNTLNFSDGANGIANSLSIYWVFMLIYKQNDYEIFLYTLLISLLIILFFNLRKKLFLGNSGASMISVIIGILYIKIYSTKSTLFSDEIFMYFLFPGIDVIRVVTERILNKKSPFYADNTHLHHYLMKSFNQNYIWIPYIMLSIIPALLMEIIQSTTYAFIITTLIYFSIILYYKKNKKV